MSVFEEADLIERSLESFLPYVDGLIVYDGPYIGYPSDSDDKSEDGTVNKIFSTVKRLNSNARRIDPFVVKHPGRMYQSEKRTLMFSQGREGDVFLIMDGDDILFGNPTGGMREIEGIFAEDPGIEVAYIRMLHWRGAYDWRPRIIRWQPNLQYENWTRLKAADGHHVFDLKKEEHWITSSCLPPHVEGVYSMGLVNLHLGYRSKERDEKGIALKNIQAQRDWR